MPHAKLRKLINKSQPFFIKANSPDFFANSANVNELGESNVKAGRPVGGEKEILEQTAIKVHRYTSEIFTHTQTLNLYLPKISVIETGFFPPQLDISE